MTLHSWRYVSFVFTVFVVASVSTFADETPRAEPAGVDFLIEHDEKAQPTGRVLLNEKTGVLGFFAEGGISAPVTGPHLRLGLSLFDRTINGGLQGTAVVLGLFGAGAFLQVSPVPISIGKNIYLHGQVVRLKAFNGYFVDLFSAGVGYRSKVDKKNYYYIEGGMMWVKSPMCEFNEMGRCGMYLPTLNFGVGHEEFLRF